jgi:hypothetical protein
MSTSDRNTEPQGGDGSTPEATEEEMAERSIPTLVSDIARQVPELVRKEIQLLRSEVSDRLSQAGRGIGEIAAAGVLLVCALLILLQALVVALASWVGPAWSAVIVGVATTLIALVLLQMGRKNLQATSLAPTRTTEQLRHDADMARDTMR